MLSSLCLDATLHSQNTSAVLQNDRLFIQVYHLSDTSMLAKYAAQPIAICITNLFFIMEKTNTTHVG